MWDSLWVIEEESSLMVIFMPDSLRNAKVSSLLVINYTEWDVGLVVKEVFDNKDAENILNIPNSSRAVDDGRLWKYEPKGKFPVKSCYRAACGKESSQLNAFWNKIWKLATTLHVHNFLWRMCKGFLPMAEVLASRKSSFSINAQLVKVPQFEEDETVSEWTSRWISSMEEDEKNLIALICWNLWQNRNNVV
ncbi:uncharacterized protein LOC130015408 [Mercurialis annua]|uniref:uncharacterized protein LOC130015408 n=1 Tax=Mercurialis annua TaxID=3986 RepID=UPI0024AF0AAB|nr:uncharacterized protein LOC130015408 [Mercurialis annua]